MTRSMSRREFILMSGAAVAAATLLRYDEFAYAHSLKAPGDSWNQGELVHLIPIVNHERILVKTSFKTPLRGQPQLRVNGRTCSGKRSDSRGRFWQFDVDGLKAAQQYELQIVDDSGKALCDPWPLKTYPAPGVPVEHVRILAYT